MKFRTVHKHTQLHLKISYTLYYIFTIWIQLVAKMDLKMKNESLASYIIKKFPLNAPQNERIERTHWIMLPFYRFNALG